MAWLALNTAEGRLQMIIAEDGEEALGALPPSPRQGHDAPAPPMPENNALRHFPKMWEFGAAAPTPEILPLMRFAGHWHAPSQGAELLAPALAGVCERLHMDIKDIRRIAVVRGPGSFTGIRLALATASGLARATGAATCGIDYLPLLASSAWDALAPMLAGPAPTGSTPPGPTTGLGPNAPAPIAPVPTGSVLLFALTHARRDLLHMQGFSAGEGRLTALTAILVLSPALAVERIAAIRTAPGQGRTGESTGDTSAPPVLLFGSGLTKNRACIGEALRTHGIAHAVLLPETYDHPSDAALLRIAAIAEYGDDDIAPLYARPADAEENLDRIAAGLGLDPAQARTRLLDLTGRKN